MKFILGRFFAFIMAIVYFAGSVHAADFVSELEVKPRLYLSSADIERFREQATQPELAAVYADLEAQTEKIVSRWLKKYPTVAAPRSAAELIEIGKRDNPSRDYDTVVTTYALHPTPELGQVLREKLLSSIGVRQIKGYWRPLGIHEAEAAMQFLETYDLVAGSGIFSDEDRQVIKNELRNCAHFLEGWTLDNSFSQSYTDYYRYAYCLNFHIFAASSMGSIAMYFPDLPESAEWLRIAQSEIPKLFFTEFAIDGGYGEGSLHYWDPTYRALLQFMIACRNLGVHDYFSDPAMTDALRRTLAWRMNLTAPDGRSFAVGDTDRETRGAEYLIQSGVILNEPTFVWAGHSIIRKARPNLIPSWRPYDLFFYEWNAAERPLDTTFANFAYSGYGIFRSGWGRQDNCLMMKYGTTYIGRRENENNLVISGHAHADAQELELHYKGIPIIVDPGRVGRYQDWETYGGYCKATVAHNTVGIGNKWGYDRLDGLYEEHVKKHGKEFLYETSQNNIGRSDTKLTAIGDAGQISIISAKLETYDDVMHQRSVIWFSDTGVAVVHDRLESSIEQPYEWYLNPIGKLLKQDHVLTFGDETARLDVVPVLPKDAGIQIVNKGASNVPPYYVALLADEDRPGTKPFKPYVVKDRWGQFTLLVLKQKAKQAEFLNVLVPYEKTAPLTSSPLGAKGKKLTGTNSVLLVAVGGNDDPSLAVDGEFGVARLDHGKINSYALHHGHGLKLGKQELIKVELLSKPWAAFFDSAVSAAVSLADRRASFSFPISPMDQRLIMYSPKIVEGEEPPLPTTVSVSFAVKEKPKRMVALRSVEKMPQLNDPEFDRKVSGWENDPHQGHYLREQLPFTYNEEQKTVTVHLDLGIRQLVWE